MDLSNYSLRDLVSLHQQIEHEIQARRARNPEATDYHLRNLADEWGTAVADLLSGNAAEAHFPERRDVQRYQHPFDPRLTWDGTGAKPGWVRQWETSGHSLADLERRPHQ